MELAWNNINHQSSIINHQSSIVIIVNNNNNLQRISNKYSILLHSFGRLGQINYAADQYNNARQTNKQTDKQTNKQTDKQTNKQTNKSIKIVQIGVEESKS